MKTVEELLKEKGVIPETMCHNSDYVFRAVYDVIEQVQKDAYNQALEDRDNFAIEFAKWVESLSPSDRVTLWSKNGSISGLFNMDMEQLLCKYKSKTKAK